MKRFALVTPLVIFVVAWVYLSPPFLPTSWQLAIDRGVSRILPHGHDSTSLTHPALDQEIEQLFHEKPYILAVVYGVHLVLLAGTTYLFWRVLKSLRRYQRTK